MKAFEFVDAAQQRVDVMRQQAKALQKRAKEAALRLKLQKTQQRLTQVVTKPV